MVSLAGFRGGAEIPLLLQRMFPARGIAKLRAELAFSSPQGLFLSPYSTTYFINAVIIK